MATTVTTDAVPSDLPGVVLAGTASDVGKTVATPAVCRALERTGRTPAAAKAGPGFVDPSHHAAVLGRPARTLDPRVAGAPGVSASDAVVAGHPRVERPGGAAEHRGVVAGVDEVRSRLRGHGGPPRPLECAADRERCDGLADVRRCPREDDARQVRGNRVGRHCRTHAQRRVLSHSVRGCHPTHDRKTRDGDAPR